MGAAASLLLLAVNTLSLEEAVRTAEQHQPQILQARAQTDVARARSLQSLSNLLPSLQAAGTYSRQTHNTVPQPGLTPTGIPVQAFSWDTVNFWNFSVNASQMIWDFQSYDRYQASRATVMSAEETEEAARLTTIGNARTAFFAARAQKALVQVARETLANQQRHLAQIEGFVRLGSRPEIDLAQARSDTANARVQLINAENNYEVAKANLNQAIGVEASTDYDVADQTLPPVPGEDDPPSVLVEEALRDRPEFRSYAAQLRAQELIIRAAKGAYLPGLTTGATFSGRGTDITNLGWNLGASLSLTWTFAGGLPIFQVREQRANLELLDAQLAQLRLQARVEVEQARLAVRAAKASVEAAAESLVNAKERLRLAEGRYQAGVGSIIELGDAQVAETSAAAQSIQAEYNLATARAQLLHALGRR